MARKKKGEEKLVTPKNIGTLLIFKTVLKVYYEKNDWLTSEELKTALHQEYARLNLEEERKKDGSDYTKDVQLPRYFGLVTRPLGREDNIRAEAQITTTGKKCYEALLSDDWETVHRILFNAITTLQFGRNNQGCGSESDCEPLGVFFRASYLLDGLTNAEYGYLLGEMDGKKKSFLSVIEELRQFRTKKKAPPTPKGSLAHTLKDAKPIVLLKNLKFLSEDENSRTIVSPSIDEKYHSSLANLPIYNSLKALFRNWLIENKIETSNPRYPDSIEAVSLPSGTVTTNTFPGIFERLTGHTPQVGTFAVSGRLEFDQVYGEFTRFLEQETPNSEGFDKTAYDECYAYTRNHSAVGSYLYDAGRLRNAWIRYREFLVWFDSHKLELGFKEKESETMTKSILAAIRTKPFILLAGISGTGKSRMVRQLARGCCPDSSDLAKDPKDKTKPAGKPGNFEMIQVRPNWHDSTELMGYVTRITKSQEPEYVLTPFVKFLVKAWLHPEMPFFLCLDEMNLAPVEQYFAEYLSMIETRRIESGSITTDVLVNFDVAQSPDSAGKPSTDQFVKKTAEALLEDYKPKAGSPVDPKVTALEASIKADKGLRIPPNLVVMGTVNMDETTCTFSRKVLDRAMSFELNKVDMGEGLEDDNGIDYGAIAVSEATPRLLNGRDAWTENQPLCEKVKAYLVEINTVLDKTPFKIAYRSRDEIMVYCLERTKGREDMLAQALDEATSMKILSRIEGDSQHVKEAWLAELKERIGDELAKLPGFDKEKNTVCSEKLDDMIAQAAFGYTSFWLR